MKTLKLSAKIIGGFGIVILLMIGVIGLYQFSTIQTTGGFEELLTDEMKVEEDAAEADIFLERALRAKSDFLLRKDMKYADQHKESVDGIVKYVTAIRDNEKDDHPAVAAKAAEILALTEQYRTRVDALVAAVQTIGLTEKEGLQGKFREAAIPYSPHCLSMS